MRPASGMSTDTELNVVNAVRVAADPSSAGRGVTVVLNDTIIAARDVTKSATYRVQAFVARDAGPLGYADADSQVVWNHRAWGNPPDQQFPWAAPLFGDKGTLRASVMGYDFTPT